MKLETRTVEKVWGRCDLPAPFSSPTAERVGEIWFEPPAALSGILVKYLFTSEKLSVQVHPSDAEAPEGHRGKEECWLVLDAEPGAALAIGFKSAINPETIRAAALDGSIEELLEWHPAGAGDFFYLPAGTVHAIGPGLTLVEVQQNSDITYRLYDYGRPRELHLDEAVAVARREPYADRWHRHIDPEHGAQLVEGPHFRFSQCVGWPDSALRDSHSGPVMILPLDGAVQLSGERIEAGECALADNLDAGDFTNCKRSLLVSGYR